MSNIKFTWDSRKARANRQKHGISFDEAQTAFQDDGARLMADPDHSTDEDRFLLMGYSLQANCLVVSHCYRETEFEIRIISARRASRLEEQSYWSFQ